MKKFLQKFSIFCIYALILQVVFPFIVDPFNVFHFDNIRANGVEPNKKYVKMKYILANPDKFDSFIFGSSRVGAIHTEKINGEHNYNMTTASGLPVEHLANIRTFIDNNIIPKKIYIGVDSLSYTENPNRLLNDPMRCPYEYLRDNPAIFYSLYLRPNDTIRSLYLTYSSFWELNSKAFYEYGWWIDYKMDSNFNWNAIKLSPSIGSKNLINETLTAIKKISEICNKHSIELIVFTNPMHHITYEASLEKDYFNFLEKLANITDFYNFSSLNDITLNNDNYLETSHYKAEVGDMILNVICYGKKYDDLYEQGFGVKVTKENVNDFIAMLKKQSSIAIK